MAEGRLQLESIVSRARDKGPIAEGLETLRRSAQAVLSAVVGDATLRWGVSVTFSDIFHVTRLYQCNPHVS